MRVAVFDDMRRKVVMPRPVRRVVSLVPSDTETLFDLGVGEAIVGRTRYCVEPASQVAEIPIVGGTKDIDIDHIMSLAPDLVLANQEENSRANLESLAERGATIFVSFPKRYGDAIAHLARLARIFGAGEDAKELIKGGYAELEEVSLPQPVSVFVPIWRDPLMTFSDHTYPHDLLRLCGAQNVFANRERKYPLKADLGQRSPLPADQVANRDKRYPRIQEEELIALAPEMILLPDEPHNFGEEDRAYFAGLDLPAAHAGRIHFIDGKDLFWPGSRSVGARARLRARIDEFRA
jgi:ABC-type Fe3+-hydroxamate transport system substrate-binding protein